MASSPRTLFVLTLMLGMLVFSHWSLETAEAADKLVVYSGRAERLIKPVLDEFQAKSGIQIELLSSGTTELVNRLQAEGDHTPADVFLTNDAGSLEHRPARGLAVGRAGDHALEGVLGIPGSGQIQAHGIGSWWVARASGRCAAFARCIALATPTPLIRAVPGNARGSP